VALSETRRAQAGFMHQHRDGIERDALALQGLRHLG
jgi:hypothetical protein